ncbi:type IV pilus modification protein PilV [Pseudoalteromonas sp. SG45-5]|uniref:Type IV pilus modification protein PilV n=1 Tax=Pseudoalteromonas aliena TaxID=247523 RepID=A0A1Q2H3B7_9GAMM|nr:MULTISPECIES: type IV pilus modification protein PilV [Pseudoalteromonas]AQQ01862.1 type IV pilus modification protein PilV [Pseudoalteromonas aliena]MBB1386021.1 type IV pilus modification protein PilV [Pseudoalteromonas sp. SG45-5]MBB1393833.1 type IV pilus modification protein PilV [Pseudoalteromonas sp. SG44-4]MBB1447368.1 type IV pilus modification protein PilV [Pseudoalteromonas sp. SG41-6]TMO03055.1 type IV pilus modification protein PilV [Pseudoalteromonas sp. S558]
MQSYQFKLQKGFTLIEVLIAFIILSFGLLGAVALQAKAKQASFDSMQRAAAIALGNDIVQRIRVNDSPQLATLYKQSFTSKTATNSSTTCFEGSCSAAQIALLNIEQWKRAIRARENTGSLDGATVCINLTPTGSKAFNLEVIVSWQGRQEFKANTQTSKVNCGAADKKRRLVVLTSYIYIRS